MHLQQTKVRSRATGGPQYYFHNVPAHVKEFLRERGACPVVLQTPYGITGSSFMAVGRDHKLSASGKAIPGKVGHDRVQGEESIGKAIRHWYGLKPGLDFERIDVEAVIHEDGHFILVPTRVAMRGGKRTASWKRPDFRSRSTGITTASFGRSRLPPAARLRRKTWLGLSNKSVES